MPYQHTFQRHKTREVRVGDKVVGGDNPIWVQSMTTTYTHDVEATVAEILRMEEAGCEITRVTVPKAKDAAVLSEIKRRIHLPLICDIHFEQDGPVRPRPSDGQDSDQPRQHRRLRSLSPGDSQGPRSRHSHADRKSTRLNSSHV